MPNTKSIIVTLLLIIFTLPSFSQSIRAGVHSFTIQWISFNDVGPGKVTIKPIGKGSYSIEGEQRDKANNDYVTIKGTIVVVGRNLNFDGKIVNRITSINNGKPCEFKGAAVFRASGARKYWRLQQMLNCDGETTDYIDIFF